MKKSILNIIASAAAQYNSGYQDADGFESFHRCENSKGHIGFNCRLSG